MSLRGYEMVMKATADTTPDPDPERFEGAKSTGDRDVILFLVLCCLL